MKSLLAVLVCLPAVALAEEWRTLSGSDIQTALNDQTLVYENATQQFFSSGRTLYNAGQDSWGYWTVRVDQYCSQWPPSDAWDCYDMAANGSTLRFIASDGSTTDGNYAK